MTSFEDYASGFKQLMVSSDDSINQGMISQEFVREHSSRMEHFQRALEIFEYSDFNTKRSVISPPAYFAVCEYIMTLVIYLRWCELSFEESLKVCIELSSSKEPFKFYTKEHIKDIFTKYISKIKDLLLFREPCSK